MNGTDRVERRVQSAREPRIPSFDWFHGESIRWYEMNGAAHGLSVLDRGGNKMSKDYDVSVHTQKFFEAEAEMLKEK